MKYFIFLILPLLWRIGYCDRDSISTAIQGIKTVAAAAGDVISDQVTNIPILGDALFGNCVEPPPECPNENVTFWYYNRGIASTPSKIDVNDPASFSHLRKGRSPWRVIVHGYTKSKNEIPNPEFRSAYLKKGDFDLISVDYNPLARSPCYVQAVHNVPLIANCTAQMIDKLIDEGIFQPNNLHLLGFSLGAHIVGTVHKYLKHDKPPRVTGLDPACPLFDGVLHETLTTESGHFVDIMHTNALMKGKLESFGHMDFYVNGGITQPGCLAAADNKTLSTCSHDRSPIYYAESINSPDMFWGIPCNNSLSFYSGLCDTTPENLVRMGESVTMKPGIYFLQTNSKPPFGLGKVSKARK